MKREQIIEILRQKLSVIVEQADIPGGTIIGKKIIIGKEESADAILALPLDVPSDKEIEEQFPLIDYGFCTDIERVNIGYINSKRVNIQFGMKRMRDEIIKRNK